MTLLKTTSWILLAALAPLVSGCTAVSLSRDRELRSPNNVADAEALEHHLARHPFGSKSDSWRFQLAAAYLDTETEPYDPSRARSHLWQLQGSATSPYQGIAARVLTLLKDVERWRLRSAIADQALERSRQEVVGLRREVEAAVRRHADQSESASRLQVELQSAHGKVRNMAAENASQEQEIERLTRELRELKRIDTRQAS